MTKPQPAKLNNRRYKGLVAGLIIIVALALSFGVIYFNDHAWGTWGDDSAGYIFLAGRMLENEPLVYTDGLAAAGLEFFGDEKLARWLTPTHHQFINTRGVIASKYPIGISMVLLTGAKLFGSSEGFYFVTPLLATANLILLYLLALLLFPKHRYRHLIGALSAFLLGMSGLYYNYAIAQPMREIPSMTMLLLMAILLILGVNKISSQANASGTGTKINSISKVINWRGMAFIIVSALAFGMAFNIRETSLLVLPGALIMAVAATWFSSETVGKNIRRLLPYFTAFLLSFIIAIIPTIQNSINISKEKEVFKARDTSSVVLLSNIGHVQTISLENLFDNQGKFRPGKGSLPHYWKIMQNSTPVPFFMLLVLMGIYYYWKESKPKTSFLVLWGLGILIIFSLWVNPYSRYILPMFPPLLLLGVYGLFSFFEKFLPKFFSKQAVIAAIGMVVGTGFIFGYQPTLAEVRDNLQEDIYMFKAISENDLNQLTALGNQLSAENAKPVLMFAGDWQYGTSETLQTHTGLKTIRFPLEQRFEFDHEQVDKFFDQMFTDGYDLYVWTDETASVDFFVWLEKYDYSLVQKLDFTFQPQVGIYKISGLK